MTSFKELGIAAEFCDVLRYQGIKEPTPVQATISKLTVKLPRLATLPER